VVLCPFLAFFDKKKGYSRCYNPLISLVGGRGFEPRTSTVAKAMAGQVGGQVGVEMTGVSLSKNMK